MRCDHWQKLLVMWLIVQYTCRIVYFWTWSSQTPQRQSPTIVSVSCHQCCQWQLLSKVRLSAQLNVPNYPACITLYRSSYSSYSKQKDLNVWPASLQDFSGFRVIILLPRLRPSWPAPGAYETEQPKPCARLGGPKGPLPTLLTNGKAICAATIRCGRGYIEVPFFATKESRRGRGFGRCLLEAIEEVARVVGVSKLLLCSTDDPQTTATWRHLGFRETCDADLGQWGICWGDLLHMTNTTQMVKILEPPKRWKSVVIRHEHFAQRAYYPGAEPTPRVGWKRRFEHRDLQQDGEDEDKVAEAEENGSSVEDYERQKASNCSIEQFTADPPCSSWP